MQKSTHAYVGSLPCGCGCAITIDAPEHRDRTAESVADYIRQGLAVSRFPHEQASEAFAFQCERYPHEDWQK